jgi:ubiquitin-protein ligase
MYIFVNVMSAPPTATSLPPVLASRLQKELQALATQPPPGVTCWPASESDITILHATIVAPKGSCYEGGIFTVEIQVPMRYPFEPPKARFVTPVYDRAAALASAAISSFNLKKLTQF